MAKKKTAGSIFRQIPLMVAMLAAFVFSASNGLKPLLVEGAAETRQQLEQEQADDDRPIAFVDYACDAIAPVMAPLHLFQATYKVTLPALQLNIESPQLLPSPRGSDDFFRTLFRLIISPNAP